MTREKALASVPGNLSYFNDCKPAVAIQECRLWINKIYDDFESRTCESCKYLNKDTGKSYAECDFLDTFIGIMMEKSFYCSEWEKKQ